MNPKNKSESELGRHLKLLRVKNNLTMIQTAEATGVTQGYISQIENGIYTPSAKTLSKLARAYKVAEISLLRKAGIVQFSNTMPTVGDLDAQFKSNLFDDDPLAEVQDPHELMGLLRRGLASLEYLTSQNRLKSQVSSMPSQPFVVEGEATEKSDSMGLPIYDASWQPLINASGVPGVFTLPKSLCANDKDAFVLHVGDQAMAPVVDRGDWVVISPATEAVTGNIVAINDRHKIQLRSFSNVDGMRIFNPVNPEYGHKLLISKEGENDVEIVGRVLRVVNKEL